MRGSPDRTASSEGLRPRVDLGVSCEENVRADAALLRRGVAAVRVAVLSDRAVSVGVGMAADADCLSRARDHGLPIVRRSSGGTAVLHGPGDLTWTLVLPRSDPRVGRDYARGYGRLGAGAVRFLQERGVPSAWMPSPGLSTDYCLLGPRGAVLSVADQILGGAAQHLTREGLLHHGVLPRTVDRRTLGRVFGLSPSVGLDRLTSLEELGLTEPAQVQVRQLAQALRTELEATG